MKKVISLITVFLACVVAACAVYLAGCSSDDDVYAHIIDFEKCEIGYEIPVYPDCEFDYAVSETCIIRFDKISAVLCDKNVAQTDDTIDGTYSPYGINISAHASTSPDFAGRKITLSISPQPGTMYTTVTTSSEIEETGDIEWNGTFYTFSNCISCFYFYQATF